MAWRHFQRLNANRTRLERLIDQSMTEIGVGNARIRIREVNRVGRNHADVPRQRTRRMRETRDREGNPSGEIIRELSAALCYRAQCILRN